ncbi:MAG: NAD(+)/NADH kinase [Pseudomonadales bacterium]|jgi:predicted polyphosphate/ATP-dependent NAD kinase|nr:NAD(+)/NADH kinase [Pseudomonadales bacterium]
MLDVGLLVNPIAGIGGPAGLKGSDGEEVQARARARGYRPRAVERCVRFLDDLAQRLGPARLTEIGWITPPGVMGADHLHEWPRVTSTGIPAAPSKTTTTANTQSAAHTIVAAGADLLLVVGGDGTIRDVMDAIGTSVPILGVPAGVKMHSGTFAPTPRSAAEVVARLLDGGLVAVSEVEVRDVDEVALREGKVASRFYGEVLAPTLGGYLQHTKEAGRENESLSLVEIVADVMERTQELEVPVVLGPGGTVAVIKNALGLEATLLGVDVLFPGGGSRLDADAALLDALVPDAPVAVLSFTRRQGFLLGRGNQQLSSRFIDAAWPERIWVVGTRTKLASLEGRPLLVDTDDPELDRRLGGLVEITAGYRDRLLHAVSSAP